MQYVHVYILNLVQAATMPPDRSAERFIDADPTRFPTPQNFIIQLPSDDEWSTTDEEEYVPLSQPPTPEPQ